MNTVKKGDKIAQLILEKILEVECEEVEDLDETERGDGGFGSTDVANNKHEAMLTEPNAKKLKTDEEPVIQIEP